MIHLSLIISYSNFQLSCQIQPSDTQISTASPRSGTLSPGGFSFPLVPLDHKSTSTHPLDVSISKFPYQFSSKISQNTYILIVYMISIYIHHNTTITTVSTQPFSVQRSSFHQGIPFRRCLELCCFDIFGSEVQREVLFSVEKNGSQAAFSRVDKTSSVGS